MTPVPQSGAASEAVPRATYRLQLHEEFPLREARALAPYLRDLGVSHIYASPLLKPQPHSRHGYDVCDFHQLNPELGTEADLAALVETLRAHGMGLVLDIVPNHMGIGGPQNAWWWDVLANGRDSRYAPYFDIDWDSPNPFLRGKILAPFLGEPYHQALKDDKIRVEAAEGGHRLRYGDCVFPLSVPSVKTINIEKINADHAALDALLEQQHYRLTWYRYGDSEVNYRRFFSIAGLAGLRIEDEKVFDDVMALVRQWVERGWIDGLRVDHPDGMRDPEQFLQRLKKLAPKAWLLVEKILEPGELLAPTWPVAGSSGYDFLNVVRGVFMDPQGEKPLTDFYFEFVGASSSYPALVREKKRLVLRLLLAAEVERLTSIVVRIAARDRRCLDSARTDFSDAVMEVAACFPIYRSYVRPDEGLMSKADADHIGEALREARSNRPMLSPSLFDLLADLLLLRLRGEWESDFVARFQQLTAPAMAKGAEDTAFYCFNRFAALNEVGGNPAGFGASVQDFHQFCARQKAQWPTSMLGSSTHDTKRSEDVSARLALLTEIPAQWREATLRWSAMNERHRRGPWPDRNAEYLFYQTLVGAWPLSVERALSYMDKAGHEAKEHTWGAENNEKYDASLREYVNSTMADKNFMGDVEKFVTPLIKPGYVNSLAQTLLKLTSPGVPDIYQGTELWDLSLVDPDNRRPVDFAARRALLVRAKTISAEEAWNDWENGLPKMWLIRKVLGLRAQRPELFAPAAGYDAVMAHGPASERVIAFRRGENLIAVAPRLALRVGDWGETTLDLPAGNWRNQLTGETLAGKAPMAELLRRFPVALLVRAGNE